MTTRNPHDALNEIERIATRAKRALKTVERNEGEMLKVATIMANNGPAHLETWFARDVRDILLAVMEQHERPIHRPNNRACTWRSSKEDRERCRL